MSTWEITSLLASLFCDGGTNNKFICFGVYSVGGKETRWGWGGGGFAGCLHFGSLPVLLLHGQGTIVEFVPAANYGYANGTFRKCKIIKRWHCRPTETHWEEILSRLDKSSCCPVAHRWYFKSPDIFVNSHLWFNILIQYSGRMINVFSYYAK